MSGLFPDPELIADAQDELSWDRDRDGRMKDAAAPDTAVKTEPWTGDDA